VACISGFATILAQRKAYFYAFFFYQNFIISNTTSTTTKTTSKTKQAGHTTYEYLPNKWHFYWLEKCWIISKHLY
jgi:hypothetical protein